MRLRLMGLVANVFLAAGCYGGVYVPPAIEVPALREAGQVTIGANARVMSPTQGTYGHAAVAITDRIRVAASASGAYDGSRRRGGYAELLAGTERSLGKLLQLGVLGGVGYGGARAKHAACTGFYEGYCPVPDGYVEQASARYVRYALQGYAVVRAPRIVHGGGGLRLSVLRTTFREVDGMPAYGEGHPIALEPFGFVRVGLPWLQFELQFRYTGVVNQPTFSDRRLVVPEQLTVLVGVRFVFGPSIALAWPHRQRTVRPQESSTVPPAW